MYSCNVTSLCQTTKIIERVSYQIGKAYYLIHNVFRFNKYSLNDIIKIGYFKDRERERFEKFSVLVKWGPFIRRINNHK